MLTFYSTFVNGRSRDLIMIEMRERIERANAEREIEETIQVMFLISSRSLFILTLTGYV
jgi:hypothetical protein